MLHFYRGIAFTLVAAFIAKPMDARVPLSARAPMSMNTDVLAPALSAALFHPNTPMSLAYRRLFALLPWRYPKSFQTTTIQREVTLAGKTFVQTILDEGPRRVQRTEYELKNQAAKEERKHIQLYAHQEALYGVFITAELRGKNLLRPALYRFFNAFPNVRRIDRAITHPALLHLLMTHFGFQPEKGRAPTAYVGEKDKGLYPIFFLTTRIEDFFDNYAFAETRAQIRKVNRMEDVRHPTALYIGHDLILPWRRILRDLLPRWARRSERLTEQAA